MDAGKCQGVSGKSDAVDIYCGSDYYFLAKWKNMHYNILVLMK
jgi:hypothetical protein